MQTKKGKFPQEIISLQWLETWLEGKIFYFLFVKDLEQLQNGGGNTISFTMQELIQFTGSNKYTDIHKMIELIWSKSYSVTEKKGQETIKTEFSLFPTRKIILQKEQWLRTAKYTFAINNDFFKLLTERKDKSGNFTERNYFTVNLDDIKNLSTLSALIIYLRSNAFKQTGIFSYKLDNFKTLANIGEYKRTDKINKLLQRAEKRINEKTSININLDLKKWKITWKINHKSGEIKADDLQVFEEVRAINPTKERENKEKVLNIFGEKINNWLNTADFLFWYKRYIQEQKGNDPKYIKSLYNILFEETYKKRDTIESIQKEKERKKIIQEDIQTKKGIVKLSFLTHYEKTNILDK